MRVAAHEREGMLSGERRDPKIVLRDRRSLGAECRLEFPVLHGRRGIAAQHRGGGGQGLEALQVLRALGRPLRAIVGSPSAITGM